MNNTQDTFEQLRRSFGSLDPYMSGGHQIIKTRQVKRNIPLWAKNDRNIRQMLLVSFPKLKSNIRQRKKAARWTRIIQLYFRVHKTHGQIADEMGMTLNAVKMVIRAIKWAAEGKRANGSGMLGNKKGRPKGIFKA